MQAELDNCTLYYEIHGEGRTLVLLHGLGVDRRHMVSDFEPHFRGDPAGSR